VCTPTGGKICETPTNPCKKNKCDNTTGGECQLVNDDAAKCRKDLCHEFSQCSGGVCPEGTPIKCDDGNPCTADTCEPEVGCVNTPDDKATCTDADLCTDTACKNGKCVTADAQCDPFDDCHIAGTCNPKSGFCDSPPAPPGTDCDSGAGKCDDKGKCIPNPITGEGGAGGEGTMGPGGSGAGGTTTTDGGEPPVVGNGGNGNEPTTAGGDTGTEPNGGKAGKSNTGGDTVGEGGAPEIPRHVFVRDPGGCSCSVPSSQSSSLAWLGGLAMLGTAGALARRRRARLDGATRNSRVP
jgi:MYXO-CTERM domain-containing protein